MSMQWTERYLRETGDVNDAHIADEIARLLVRRGADVPFPEVTPEPSSLSISPGFITVLATAENAILEGDVETHAQAQQRLFAVRNLIEKRTEALPLLFNEHLPAPTVDSSNKKNSSSLKYAEWNYQERIATNEYNFAFQMFSMAPSAQIALPARRVDIKFHTQQTQATPSKLTLEFASTQLSSANLSWHGRVAGGTVRPLSGGPLNQLLDTFTAPDTWHTAHPTYPNHWFEGTLTLKLDDTPMVTVWERMPAYKQRYPSRLDVMDWSEAAIKFVYDPYENTFKRYDTDPDLAADRGTSTQSSLSVSEFDALLIDTLDLIPTRTFEV